MLILALDTTSPEGGVALYRDGESLGDMRPTAGGKVNYSVALFEMTDRLLVTAGLRLADVEVFAAATGPGSFTGIRVGLAAAQGWAKAFDRPVRGVSVLEAMVEAARPQGGSALSLLDARRGEFYGGLFHRRASREAGGSSGGDFALAGDAFVANAAHISSLVSDLTRSDVSSLDVIARDQDKAAVELAAQFPSSAKMITVPGLLVGGIASVALRAAHEGCLQRPDELDALYIRRSDAELNWRE